MEHIFLRLKAYWLTANARRKGPEYGVRISTEGDPLTNLRFADDCMLFAQSCSDAKKMLKRFIEISDEYGLQVHTSKTKLLTWAQFSLGRKSIQIADNTFSILAEDECERYLGRKLCLHNCQATELDHRISASWAKFNYFREELTSKSYPLAARLRLFEALVTPTVLYGSCAWALTRTMAMDLDIVRRKMLRSVLRIFWNKNAED